MYAYQDDSYLREGFGSILLLRYSWDESLTNIGFDHKTDFKLFKLDTRELVNKLSDWALIFFIIGIVLSMIFATKNVLQEKKVKDAQTDIPQQTTFIQYNYYQ